MSPVRRERRAPVRPERGPKARVEWAAVLLFTLVAACDAASPELGRDAAFQVRDAQWAPGPPPDSVGGPDVTSALYLRATLLRDGDAQRINGTLESGSTGLWIGMDGDLGGWIIPAGPP